MVKSKTSYYLEKVIASFALSVYESPKDKVTYEMKKLAVCN